MNALWKDDDNGWCSDGCTERIGECDGVGRGGCPGVAFTGLPYGLYR